MCGSALFEPCGAAFFVVLLRCNHWTLQVRHVFPGILSSGRNRSCVLLQLQCAGCCGRNCGPCPRLRGRAWWPAPPALTRPGVVIAAVYEDEIYYHRGQCDMITMILRLAAKAGLGIRTWATNDARGGSQPAALEVAEPESSIKPAPGRGCCIATSVLQGSSVILRKHTRARMVCAIIELFFDHRRELV